MVPPLEVVGEAHAVSLSPQRRTVDDRDEAHRHDFQEFDSNSSAMIVLEGDQPLGDDAHDYYDGLIEKLEADTRPRRSTSRTSGAIR